MIWQHNAPRKHIECHISDTTSLGSAQVMASSQFCTNPVMEAVYLAPPGGDAAIYELRHSLALYKHILTSGLPSSSMYGMRAASLCKLYATPNLGSIGSRYFWEDAFIATLLCMCVSIL